MNGFLDRVGIDSTCGNWNAPALADGRFVYVPIPESSERQLREGHRRTYDELMPALKASGVSLPAHLSGRAMHLDPDFEHLTYGDQGSKAKRLDQLQLGDFIAFYGGFRNIQNGELVYALFGLLEVQEKVAAASVPDGRWYENAHTRRKPQPGEIVFRGSPRRSGRCATLLDIGEYRNRAYRVRSDLLRTWGGLSVNDGYLQRSANPPRFLQPELFLTWFERNAGMLVRRNWDT